MIISGNVYVRITQVTPSHTCHALIGQLMLLLGTPLGVCRVLVPKEVVGKQSHFCFSNSGH